MIFLIDYWYFIKRLEVEWAGTEQNGVERSGTV